MLTYRQRDIANLSIASVQVLVYQALHDTYGFGRRRFARIEQTVNEYSERICTRQVLYDAYVHTLEAEGLDRRLRDDCIRWLRQAVNAQNHTDRRGAAVGMEYTYVLILFALYEVFGFRRTRIRRIQEKVKTYARILREGDVRIQEFMKCMQCECGQEFVLLNEYEAEHGELRIYG